MWLAGVAKMAEEDKNQKLRFVYKDSPAYRTVHVQGAYGGLTPTGQIFAGVYSERTDYPESSVLEIDPTGHVVGKEQYSGVSTTYVREVEVGLLMSLDTAKSFHSWLAERIKILEKAIPGVEAEKPVGEPK
jgi:hypothetical protein